MQLKDIIQGFGVLFFAGYMTSNLYIANSLLHEIHGRSNQHPEMVVDQKFRGPGKGPFSLDLLK